MRRAIILASAAGAIAATYAADVRAEEWCGYAARPKALIECGYSSVAQCENAIGKGGMCFLNPDYALLVKQTVPVITAIAANSDAVRR